MDELWVQIRSLERRANSRDNEALSLNESIEGDRKYLLSVESRELRKQAQKLRKQHADSMVKELGNRIDSQVHLQFGGPTTGYTRPPTPATIGGTAHVRRRTDG
jgi:hypothetical protein